MALHQEKGAPLQSENTKPKKGKARIVCLGEAASQAVTIQIISGRLEPLLILRGHTVLEKETALNHNWSVKVVSAQTILVRVL